MWCTQPAGITAAAPPAAAHHSAPSMPAPLLPRLPRTLLRDVIIRSTSSHLCVTCAARCYPSVVQAYQAEGGNDLPPTGMPAQWTLCRPTAPPSRVRVWRPRAASTRPAARAQQLRQQHAIVQVQPSPPPHAGQQGQGSTYRPLCSSGECATTGCVPEATPTPACCACPSSTRYDSTGHPPPPAGGLGGQQPAQHDAPATRCLAEEW